MSTIRAISWEADVPLMLTAGDFAPLRADPAYMREVLDAVEAAIVAHHHGTVRQSRVVDRVPGEFEGLRVSVLAGEGLLSGMRVFGNPPHTRAFLLFDGTTRALLALMDYSVLNSMRVGATAGVAARYLAPRGATTVGLLGSGWQAPPQLFALQAALPALERVRVFSRTREHRERFAEQMSSLLELPVDAVDSAESAIRGVDVVDLCAPGHFDVREPLFESEWIKPGALVISMAGNQYPPDFANAASLVVDIPETEATLPLGAVIAQEVAPRMHSDDQVIYRLEGGTVQDLFVATWGFNWAKARGLGKDFNLSAE
ncbi:MAG: ornithine cyclodeaminase family protein [Chloroflexi bacterium]|nr:ornithine cyclodeaminase family protein [Chloroflexota bacterium]